MIIQIDLSQAIKDRTGEPMTPPGGDPLTLGDVIHDAVESIPKDTKVDRKAAKRRRVVSEQLTAAGETVEWDANTQEDVLGWCFDRWGQQALRVWMEIERMLEAAEAKAEPEATT